MQFHVIALISIVAGILNLESSLTFIIWPFESHIAAAAGAVFSLNAHYKTAFSLLDEKPVHLMGQQSPIFLVKVKINKSELFRAVKKEKNFEWG